MWGQAAEKRSLKSEVRSQKSESAEFVLNAEFSILNSRLSMPFHQPARPAVAAGDARRPRMAWPRPDSKPVLDRAELSSRGGRRFARKCHEKDH
jgi:hypothetical protein